VQDGKRLFYRQLEVTMDDAYQLAGDEMASKMCEAEAREGFDAFLNKKPPPWRQSK
jgi:enoyl-CoA hydratase/carnithine racemase